LDYEPSLALFVSDEDPLVFYRTIALFACVHLSVGGMLFFEINEFFGREMVKMLTEMGFSSVVCHRDIHGRDRMVSAVKK
ncbi:MAG: protein-(glutamine-N5) methyltransferase, release factor-specific, partial [Flavobacteriales bacterium]|nr:protein-(glutamine-N5) methyltransferase, release factor-specific [Flavobacteriales bacterium]